jgi:hypothetical protein
MKKLILICFLCSNLAHAAKKDEINFDDLQRQGAELSKTVVIPQISKEADSYMRDFIGSDTVRTEERNARSSYSGSGSSGTSSSDNSTSSSNSSSKNNSRTSKNFSCHVYCKSVNGPVTWIDVSAESRRAAADYIDSHGHEICRESGYSNASNSRFKESQCAEK